MAYYEAKYEMAFSTCVIRMEDPYDHANLLCKQWLALTLPPSPGEWSETMPAKARHVYRASVYPAQAGECKAMCVGKNC